MSATPQSAVLGDELTEEVLRAGDVTDGIGSSRGAGARKNDPARTAQIRPRPATQPKYITVDIDDIVVDPRYEHALRRAGIDFRVRPKLGLIAEKGVRALMYSLPIQVIRANNIYRCVGGVITYDLARYELKGSRDYSVQIHQRVEDEDILRLALVDQILLRLLTSVDHEQVPHHADQVLKAAELFPEIFPRHSNEVWARYIGRSSRSLRKSRASKKGQR